MQVRQALYRQFVLKRANLDVHSPDVVNSFVDWATYAPSASNVSDALVECGKLASSFAEGSPRKLLLSACAVRLNSCLQSGRASLVLDSKLEKNLVLNKPKSTIDRLMQVRCWVILGEAFFERRQFVAASNCFAQAFEGAYKERYSTDIAGKNCIFINYLLSLRLCGNERELERIVAGPEAKALAGKSKEARSSLAMMRCLSVRRRPTHTEVQQIAEDLPNLHVAYLNSDYFICVANEVATELKRMHDRRIAEIFASGLADCERSGCFDDSHAVQLRRIINKLLSC
ncbi:MAG: hypothetical protein K2W95_35970 [Candidatus Obscuribacterales bacterium]|nr:hypothetical protein [Candidatus Obscuribacterales bacterium]